MAQQFTRICIFLIAFLPFFSISNAQHKDTTVFDFDQSSGCAVCGDNYTYFNTQQVEVIDTALSGKQLSKVTVILKYMSCATDDVYVNLNGLGRTMGSLLSGCACGTVCDSVTYVFTEAELAQYYQSGDTNVFEIAVDNGSFVYADRLLIIREYRDRVPNDAGVVGLNGDLRRCSGSTSIAVNVANFGSNQISSMDVNWTWNGSSQTKASLSSTLDTMGSTSGNLASISLGSKSVSPGNSYVLRAWTDSPNGSSDTINSNDTVEVQIVGSYSDTLTVGGTSPRFSSLQEAFDSLMTFGVCGPVVLKIRDGVYSEQLTLAHIPGSGPSNHLTVCSESGDSSKVTFSHSSGSSLSNYVLLLSNASYVTFRDITFESLSTSYPTALRIEGFIRHFQMEHCALIAPSVSSTGSSRSLVYRIYNSAGDSTVNVLFNQCLLLNGSYGLYMINSYVSSVNSNFIMNNCMIHGQYAYNVYCSYMKNLQFTNNQVERGSSSYTYGYGIRFRYLSDSFDVLNNIVLQKNGGSVLELSYCHGSSSRKALVANNMFATHSVSSSSTSYGQYIYSCTNTDFVHNSVYRYSGGTSGYANYVEASSSLSQSNCIYSNGSSGSALFINNTSGTCFSHSDHNLFYNGGNSLGSYEGNAINSLADLQSEGVDSNSYSSDPGFAGHTDLHAYSVDAADNGIADSRVTHDIDGEARSSTPDIGVDEFKLKGNDIGVSSIIPFSTGNSCLQAVVTNFGSNTISSFSIDWELDGVAKSSKSWSGSLAKGDTAIICLDTFTAQRDSVYLYTIWTFSPNSGIDSVTSNDTFSGSSTPALNGIYTIGGSSPDFTSIADAVSSLKNGGVLDSALFRIRDGIYTTQFELESFPGPGIASQVVFESESKDSSKVTIRYSSTGYSNNYVVRLNNTTGVTFRHLTFENTSGYYRRVVDAIGSNPDIQFRNCVFMNLDSTSTSSNSALIYAYNGTYSGWRIANSRFQNGSFSIYMYGNSSQRSADIAICDNRFIQPVYYGLFQYFCNDVTVSGNYISSVRTNFRSGIYLYDNDETQRIFGNQIFINSPSVNGGIVTEYVGSFGDTAWIYNNMVRVSGSHTGYAFYNRYGATTRLAYNSFWSQSTDSSISAACRLLGGSYQIWNNIMAHSGKGRTLHANSVNIFVSDHNNFFSDGQTLMSYQNVNHSGLSSFVSSLNTDSNSISSDPIFISSDDLHVYSADLNGAGTPINGITTDIDGESRNATTPDIGADEFTPPAVDAGVTQFLSPGSLFKADTIPIRVVVTNFGTDSLHTVKVKAHINSDTLTRVLFTPAIASGDTFHAALGTYVFMPTTNYNIHAYTLEPNGGSDQRVTNDTLFENNRTAALSGVYTIGGTSPDFPTFTAAVNALKASGVADSVRFKVRSGSYNEQLRIPEINGPSEKNTIVFESESRDSSAVTLWYNSSFYDTNYVVYIKGADGVTFRDITFDASGGSSYNRAIQIDDGARNNCFFRNKFVGRAGTSSWNSRVFVSDSDAEDNLMVKQNRFVNGSIGLYLYEYMGSFPYNGASNIQIIQNFFDGQYSGGLYIDEADSVTIDSNRFQSDRYSYYYGMNIEDVNDGSRITRNFLNCRGSRGMDLSSLGSSNHQTYVANNSVILTNSSSATARGVIITGSPNLHFYHNSVYVNCNGNSNGLYVGYSSDLKLRNNVIVDENGVPVYFSSDNLDTSNHNVLYTPNGSGPIEYDGVLHADLNSWQSANGFDQGSWSMDPVFRSPVDIEIRELDLYGAAPHMPLFPIDAIGVSRDTSGTAPGAFEMVLPPLDIGIAEVLTPQMPFPADSQHVAIIIRNYGNATINSAQIDWEFNGVAQSTVSVNDTLESGDTLLVRLGRRFFERDSSYSFKAWTYGPNSQTDTVNSNDTVFLENQFPALSGIYTIGGASPDFSSFTDAIAALNKGGIVDSVRFDVRDGDYTEQIILGHVLGVTGPNSIIFQSENQDTSKVSLTTSTSWSNQFTVLLDSASGITFRLMTLKTKGTTYARIIELRERCSDIGFENCRIYGYQNSNTSGSQSLVYGYNYNSFILSDISFSGCDFVGGSYGAYLYNYHSSNSRWLSNLVIDDCSFRDQYYRGLHLVYHRNTSITNSTFTTSSAYTSSMGVYMDEVKGGLIFTGNQLSGWTNYAAYLSDVDGSAGDTSLVANNFFSCSGSSVNYTVYLRYPMYMHFVYNNMYANGGTSSAACRSYYPSNLWVHNNNFLNAGTGYAYRSYGSLPVGMDHNNFHTSGTNLNQSWSTNYTSLSNWQSGTSRDGNSLNVDPDYISTTDLHVRETDLNEAGLAMNHLVSTDIDGAARDSTQPDIGADEFDIPAANDAGVVSIVGPNQPFTAGVNQVTVIIENYGSDSLKSATINWSVNGITKTSVNWTGGLKTGESDTVNVDTVTLKAGNAYDLIVWTSSPNGQTDSINYNDTAEALNLRTGLIGHYTVGGLLPDFATIGDAINRLSDAGAVGDVFFDIRSGTYEEELVIEAYPGMVNRHKITFQSESGDSSDVVIRFKSGVHTSNNLVYLDGAENIGFHQVTFDGSNNYYYMNALRYGNGSHNLCVTNCHFKLYNKTYYNYYSAYGIYSSGQQDDSLLVENCRFDYGSIGIYTYASTSGRETGIVINNNAFSNQRSRALQIYFADGFHVTRNTVDYHQNATSQAFYLYSSVGSPVVSHNTIRAGHNTYGGIYWYSHFGSTTQKALISNNFIAHKSDGYSTVGMEFYDCDYMNIYHNSIHLFGGTSSNSFGFLASNCNSLDLRNNIVVNNSGGYAISQQSSSFSQSDYNNIYTSGTNIAKINSTDYTSFSAWKTATSKDANSVNILPVFNSNTDLHTGMVNLDSAGTPIALVTDDIDGEARNSTHPDIGADEFQSLPKNLGVSGILYPIESCEMDTVQVKVNIFNYGNTPQSGFTIRYQLGTGSVRSQTVNDTVGAGSSIQIEFTAKEKLVVGNSYQLLAWTDLTSEQFRANDTTYLTFSNYEYPDSITSMFPADSTEDLDYPITLSWLPATGATEYDVYIWHDTASKPSSPTLTGLTQITYQLSSGAGLLYGAKYHWQVIAKNSSCEQPGRIQWFRLKHQPDLIVSEVNGPSSGFSGSSTTVSWKVKNDGLGQTTGNWWDIVYLSSDQVLGSGDQYMGAVQNPSGLNPGSDYSSSLNVTLPNGIAGKYYFIIKTEGYGYLAEANETNNITSDSGGTTVTLTPPPDLIVESIVRQSTGFSGSSTTVFYTVKNDGTGDTRSGQWYDRIYISDDTVFDGSDTYLKQVVRSSNLSKDSTYSNSVSVTLPNYISGGHYFFITTDYLNNEYEHGAESNNTSRSDSIRVILTPPPDLVVTNVETPDTVSNREVVTIRYNVINDGGSSTGRSFYDLIYISSNPVFDDLNATVVASQFHSTLPSKDTSAVARSVVVPNGMNGSVYWHVVTDAYKYVNEVSNENNNVSDADTSLLLSPDLSAEHVSVPASDTTGHPITMTYTVKNNGPGKARNDTRIDSFYISQSPLFSSAAAGIGRVVTTPATSLEAGDSINYSVTVTIPDGLDGTRYFWVRTNATHTIFENGSTANNTASSDSMDVILAPYPDLVPEWNSYPDSSAAGELISIEFKVENKGLSKADANWKDRIYLSKNPTLNLSNAEELAEVIRGGDLEKDSSYDLNAFVRLPAALSRGHYYLFAYTDFHDDVYEHFGDTNNLVRTDSVFIDGYPPVDLVTQCLTHVDSGYSGQSLAVTYTVKNEGQAVTGVSSWTDAFYLSTDSFWSTDDTKVSEVSHVGALTVRSSYTTSTSIILPNGVSGDYYLFLKADIDDRNNDEDTSNNYNSICAGNAAAQTKVILTTPPDLKIVDYTIPSSGTSGQLVEVIWEVKNEGSGGTQGSSWVDKMYLSTDANLDNSDQSVGQVTHYGALSAGSSYRDTVDLSIPGSFVGNYYLFIVTDVADVEYEHGQEANNTISSVISLSKAPPADLVVTSVTAPDSVSSGKSMSVTWTVKNQGSNPSTGYLTDNVYLSKDQKQDASDLLLYSESRYVNMAPNATYNGSKTVTVSGVELGNYYVLVSTDVLNNINESNDTNNTAVPMNQTNVNVPLLALGVWQSDTLEDNEDLYYRIIIPDSLDDESLLVELKGDSSNGNNQMYIRRAVLASGSQFDYKYREPFSGNQDLIVPELDTGTYYLYVTGNTSAGNSQVIQLRAGILPFEIRKVTPSEGGNAGEITLKIEGSKFDTATVFSLNRSVSTNLAGENVGERDHYEVGEIPKRVDLFDPTIAYATFDLTGYERGIYDVSADKDEGSATKDSCFTVVASTGEDLQVDVVRPSNTRANRVISIDILFTNKGNNDIVGRTIDVVSSAGAPISLTADGLSNGSTTLSVVVEGNEGPPGRLGAGSSGSVKIYIESSQALGIIVNQ
jgi:hypothetical protein